MQDTVPLAPPLVPPAMMSEDVLALIADAVICTDEDGRILLFNRAAERSFGYSASEAIGQHVDIMLPQRFRAEHPAQIRSFASGDGSTERLMGHSREVWGRRKNGEEFPAEATVSRQVVNGRTILTVVHRDITERKQLEHNREAIARELDHRIGNVLSVVNSLVRLSARNAANVAEFEQSLLGRLSALARTLGPLRLGAQQSTSLQELCLAELELYRTSDEANIILEGPPVALGSRSAQALALVIHELATNSAKYGALSVSGGRVTVTSAFTGEGDKSLLTIEWRETGGPTAKLPERQGFGTGLIKQVIAMTFRANAVMEYPPEGLVCRMTLPQAALAAPGRG